MPNEDRPFRETFLARAVRLYRENTRYDRKALDARREEMEERASVLLGDMLQWAGRHQLGLSIGLGLPAGLLVWTWFADLVAESGKKGGAGQEWDLMTVVLVLGTSVLMVGAAKLLVMPLFHLIVLLMRVALSWQPAIWPVVYGAWRALYVVGQCLLLVPLFGLFVVTRAIQLYRGIFHTCPARRCAYRGLPAYVCDECGEINEDLWPNLYGLLSHPCVECGRALPTLDVLARDRLQRRCGNETCRMPLLGRHGGRVPERLVAIAGGPSSGKTCYLLMAVHQIISGQHNGAVSIDGEIDDTTQEQTFEFEWQGMARGQAAAKTVEVANAFLLYASVGGSRCQLYLYDAPGEEFGSVGAMTAQQYIPLLEGFILLVDPLSFYRARVAGGGSSTLPLEDVVASTLGTALSSMPVGPSGRISKRVAVVLSKADLLVGQIGDIRLGPVDPARCRDAIMRWGGQNAVRQLEHRFESVAYFACSPLGRDADHRRRQPFSGSGVLEPLHWVLTGRADGWYA